MKIALLGCGNIGNAIAKSLLANQYPDLELKYILVKDMSKSRLHPLDLYITDINIILNDHEIDLVIEVLGNEEPAKSYVTACLESSKHIVTANKELIAKHGILLFGIAEQYQRCLRFEAAVGGGIPIINTMLNELNANKIHEIKGILNGTTNYILSQMEKGLEFSQALIQAQEQGYAEPDPTNDIEGYDVRYKISILASIIFGQYISHETISCQGISKICKEDFSYAQELGYTIKLLGHAKVNSNGYSAIVSPYLIPKNHHLASIHGAYNAIALNSDLLDELIFIGQGAGASATSSAILGDVIAIQNNILNNNIPYNSDMLTLTEDNSRTYIRMVVHDQAGVIGHIGACFGTYDISIESIIQKIINQKAHLCIITHAVSDSQLNQALDKLQSLSSVIGIGIVMKII